MVSVLKSLPTLGLQCFHPWIKSRGNDSPKPLGHKVDHSLGKLNHTDRPMGAQHFSRAPPGPRLLTFLGHSPDDVWSHHSPLWWLSCADGLAWQVCRRPVRNLDEGQFPSPTELVREVHCAQSVQTGQLVQAGPAYLMLHQCAKLKILETGQTGLPHRNQQALRQLRNSFPGL